LLARLAAPATSVAPDAAVTPENNRTQIDTVGLSGQHISPVRLSAR